MQIRCEPYACTLSEESCAARHARSLVPPRAGLVRHQHVHCAGCAEGAERAARLGVVSGAGVKVGVNFALRVGEAHENAKLTDAQVAEMRAGFAAGRSQAGLAAEFGTSRANVSLIVRGKARTRRAKALSVYVPRNGCP